MMDARTSHSMHIEIVLNQMYGVYKCSAGCPAKTGSCRADSARIISSAH